MSRFSFSTRPSSNFCYLSPPLPHTVINMLGVCPLCCSVLWSKWGLKWELHGVFLYFFNFCMLHRSSGPCVFIAFWLWCFSVVAVVTALWKPSLPTITETPQPRGSFVSALFDSPPHRLRCSCCSLAADNSCCMGLQDFVSHERWCRFFCVTSLSMQHSRILKFCLIWLLNRNLLQFLYHPNSSREWSWHGSEQSNSTDPACVRLPLTVWGLNALTFFSSLLFPCLSPLPPQPPVVKTEMVTISDTFAAQKTEIATKEVPIVHTETKTITYEAAQVLTEGDCLLFVLVGVCIVSF